MADDPAIDPADPVTPAGDPPADPPVDPPQPNGAGDPPTDPPDSDEWRSPDRIADTKLRDHAGRFTSVVDLLGKHFELRQQLSTAIQPLGKDATDEQVASHRKAMGVPETAEGYVFTAPEGQEFSDNDKEFHKSASEMFHTNNIPVEAANAQIAWFNEYAAQVEKNQLAEDKAFADESEAALKVEWPGKEFERNTAFADRAAAKVFGDELDNVRNIETKDGRFVLDNPAFVKMLAGIGREMSEGRLGTVMTEGDEAALDTEIDDLETQMDKATADGDGVKANDLFIKQQELYRKKFGSVPVVGSEGRSA